MVWRIYKFTENNDELQAAFDIRRQVFIEEQGVPEEIEMDEYDVEALHLIVLEEGMPIATARLRFPEEEMAKIERMAVLKEYRYLGIGTEMISFITDELAERQVVEVVLHAQSRVVDFYKSCGFKVTSGTFLEAGIEHVEMRREI